MSEIDVDLGIEKHIAKIIARADIDDISTIKGYFAAHSFGATIDSRIKGLLGSKEKELLTTSSQQSAPILHSKNAHKANKSATEATSNDAVNNKPKHKSLRS